MAAAPNACTTSRVSTVASRFRVGASKTPGQDGEAGADDPGPPPHRRRAGAAQVEQLGVVDHAPHGQAEPGSPEEHEQGHGRGQRDAGDDHLVFADEHAADVERVLRQPGREGARQRAERRREEALDHQDQADRGDHLHGRGRVGQPARHRLHAQAEHRADHEYADQRGGHGGQVQDVVVQDVEDVGAGGGHSALGEVEDARRFVGEHQAGAGQAVDRTGGDAEDHEREQRIHLVISLSRSLDPRSARPAGAPGIRLTTGRSPRCPWGRSACHPGSGPGRSRSPGRPGRRSGSSAVAPGRSACRSSAARTAR